MEDELLEHVDPGESEMALDLLLTDAALGLVYQFRPRTAVARMAGNLAKKPTVVATRTTELARELAKVTFGESEVAPQRGDRRFSDEAWNGNPVLRRVVQGYLAAGKTAKDLLEDAELSYADHERAEFLIRVIDEAMAPTNSPALNPTVWQELKATNGRSALRGAKAFASDMVSAPRTPSMVESDAFTVGEDLAVSPGAVVERTEMYELIQYQPTTEKVFKRPLVIVPPMINKFYAVDLAPGRSMVEYLVSRGHQVFVISWRNPTAENAEWGFDAYGESIIRALDTSRAITKSPKANLYALCSGGIVTSMVMAHLKATGRDKDIASLALAVTVLDQGEAGIASAALNENTAKAAIAVSAARGYLDGRNLAEVFSWLRPTDLIWNYWVNNYLLGRKPPKFDVLYWNADTTRMSAGLHRDFVNTGLHNSLVTPGEATMLGTPVDLSTIDTDAYVIAGIADHICAWSSCYATTQMLGGETEFVLSSSGHIAAIINPPGNPRAKYRKNSENPPTAREWAETSQTHSDSWWPDYSKWLGRRSGTKVLAPQALGSEQFPPVCAAPGSYITEP